MAVKLVLASQISGLFVYDADAKEIGSLVDLELDASTLEPKALIIELSDPVSQELFQEKPVMGRLRVKIPARFVKRIGDTVVLTIGIAEAGKYLEKL